MDVQTLLICAGIILARVTDVSLGTMRTLFVIRGKRAVAVALGFFEVLIWVTVVSHVIVNLNVMAYAVSYALGFALGNFIGMTIEGWMSVGEQVLRVFTRMGGTVAESLREAGFRVTEFTGVGRDGPVYLLLIQTRRRNARTVAARARSVDPHCYYILDDVRLASSVVSGSPAGGLRGVAQRE
jgi:uncharacterized protein YebE (UPF0316 family)